jgi:hypothetical protein
MVRVCLGQTTPQIAVSPAISRPSSEQDIKINTSGILKKVNDFTWPGGTGDTGHGGILAKIFDQLSTG